MRTLRNHFDSIAVVLVILALWYLSTLAAVYIIQPVSCPAANGLGYDPVLQQGLCR